MILSITVKEIMVWNGNLIYVIRNVSFAFDFKKLLENALRFVTDSWIFCHAQHAHSRGPTHDFGSVTQIAFKYKHTGFRTKFFQKWFLCPLFGVCLFITVGLSTVAGQLHKLCFQFWLSGPSLCATLDFLVLEVFNSNNLLSEAVVGLKLFYPKSFRKQFCAFLKAPNFT